MRKLVAVFVVMMALPLVAKAQATNEIQRPDTVPGGSSEVLPSASNPQKIAQGTSAGPVDTQSEAFNICMRATQRFEQQEKAKGNKNAAEAPISASCKTELKPAAYWLCMDKEASAEVDFNTAHWRCAKQTNIVK
ncbi:MAG: hypothetical protein ACXV8O_17085 [Methylobacter sp.]